MGIAAFTSRYKGLSNVLINEVGVIDPVQARLSGQNEPSTKIRKYKAIWDTGATNSVITSKIIEDLNLKPIGVVKVCTPNKESYENAYIVDFWLPNNICIRGLKVTEGIMPNADILTGMDVMILGDFTVSNYQGNTTFSFRCPSMNETDYVKEIRNANQYRNEKAGRNNPCPCGSGKKFKHCCGQSA